MVMPAQVIEANKASDETMSELDRMNEENVANTTSLDDVDTTVDPTSAGLGEPQPRQEEELEEALTSDKDLVPDFEQKYKTLMGKYNAEVPRLQSQINEMNSRMSQILTQPPTESAAAETRTTAKPAVDKDAHTRYLEKEEVDEYGAEILELQARMARGVAEALVEAHVQPLLNRVDFLESRLESSSASSYWERVEQQVPDAETTNASDPIWHDFLKGVEPNSGLTFREIGEKAYNGGDVGRMVNLLKQYHGTSGTGTDTAPTRKETPPVKPGRSSGSPEPTATPEAPRFSESGVKKFYSDKARGFYKGREDVADAKERMIESAMEEGRIVAG